MPDNPLETTYFAGFVVFFIDVTTETVLKVFYSHVGGSHQANTYLSSQKVRGILNNVIPTQLSSVCSNNANPDTFDISTLITILTCGDLQLLRRPLHGWNAKPPGTDISTAADLLRLRVIRNSIVAHRNEAKLSEEDFEKWFQEVENILKRITKEYDPNSVSDLERKIGRYKNIEDFIVIDKKNYFKKLQQWHNELEKQMQKVLDGLEGLKIFFESSDVKHRKYIELLSEGGRLVLSVFLQTVLDQRGETIRQMLISNRDKLQTELLRPDMIHQPFPPNEVENTDVNSWSLLVLAKVILIVFYSCLKRNEKKNIESILKQMQNLAETTKLALHKDSFTNCCADLIHNVMTLAESLDEDTESQVEILINRFRSETEDVGNIDEHLKKLGCQGFASFIEMYKASIKEFKDALEQLEDADIYFKSPHVLKIKIELFCEDAEKKKLAGQELTTLLQDAIKSSGKLLGREQYVPVSVLFEMISQLENMPTVKVLEVKEGCVILSITCQSKQGILQLVDFIESPMFQTHMTAISNYFEGTYQEMFILTGYLTLDSLHKAHPDQMQYEQKESVNLSLSYTSPEETRKRKWSTGKTEEDEPMSMIYHDVATSLEADLCRLKEFRNEIAHISSTTGFDQASLLKKWTDIEDVLLRLNSAVIKPVRDLQKILHTISYKHSPFEPGAEKRTQADIENWREMEEALEKMELKTEDVMEVKGVKTKVEQVMDAVGKVKKLKTPVKEAKEARMQDLQDDLISFNRAQHRTISMSPLIDTVTPLLEFYVIQDIYSLKVRWNRSGVKQVRTPVTPLRNMFYNDNKMYHNIYLTADAALGKTALSKRLTLAWCHAKKPHKDEAQFFSQEEIQAVNEFHFVFFLSLRNSSSECDIDDLIWNQIILKFGHHYTREDLVNILCEERCLVILDGLDQWTHPSNSCKQGLSTIPHRKLRARTAVLTTTRPWKLCVSGLMSSQVDQNLELLGLNQKSANILKRSVISHMSNEKNEIKLQHEVEAFTKLVKEKQISDLEAIPLFLMYMLFLWCNKIQLGQTQCDLYSQITELLLSRTVETCVKLAPEVDLPQGEIPQCFSGNTHCMQFYTLLTSLGQLAYETLFNEKREENMPVFDGSVAEQYLKESLQFCFKTGLLTQSKVSEHPFKKKFKVSFAHKTVQEFFAALYMHSTSDQTSVPEIVLSKCKCIEDILEMSKTLKFICGMNVNVSSLISRKMMKIINEDTITRKYRSSPESSTSKSGLSHPLKDFQDMCISCCKEIPHENEVSLHLQDVFIEKSCEQEQYREILKQLTTRNKQNIRSLYIKMDDMDDTPYKSVLEVIEYFALSDLENIEKIHYEGECNDHDILPLLNKTVKCVHLSCREELGSWSRLLFEKVTSLQKLEAIHISKFEPIKQGD